MTRRLGRILTRGAALIALVALTLLALAPAAAAHVAVDSATPNGDGTSTVTLVWNHSCTPDSATTGVSVSAGPGVEFTGAITDVAGWSATVAPSTIEFSGPGVPTGQQAAVRVTARITADPGATVSFPSSQYCGDQQTAWTDPDPSSDHPVPTLIATAAIATPAAATGEATSQAVDGGADLAQVLTGVLLLTLALGTAGVVLTRRAGG
ncbi:MAG: DUF1775 domain-containing protein [Nakamurella multipartita]